MKFLTINVKRYLLLIAICLCYASIAEAQGVIRPPKQQKQERPKPTTKPNSQTTTTTKPNRGVVDSPTQARSGIQNINGHDAVDLGLPSGVKWATCNVGASSPSDYGNYFAWGETSTKDTYTPKNCRIYGVKIDNIAGLSTFDVARAKWGSSWRLPTEAEMQELVNKCRWLWTTNGGQEGYKVTGPNGNSIFLPAAGNRNRSLLNSVGQLGNYWTGSGNINYLYFDNRSQRIFNGSSFLGQSVRPVTD